MIDVKMPVNTDRAWYKLTQRYSAYCWLSLCSRQRPGRPRWWRWKSYTQQW